MKRILKKKYGKRKDWRESYRGSRRFDSSCRCHGGCPYCLRNRMYSYLIKKKSSKKEIKDYAETKI